MCSLAARGTVDPLARVQSHTLFSFQKRKKAEGFTQKRKTVKPSELIFTKKRSGETNLGRGPFIIIRKMRVSENFGGNQEEPQTEGGLSKPKVLARRVRSTRNGAPLRFGRQWPFYNNIQKGRGIRIKPKNEGVFKTGGFGDVCPKGTSNLGFPCVLGAVALL